MTCWIKHLGIFIYITWIVTLSACQNNEPSLEALETPAGQPLETSLPETLNCPIIIEPYESKNKRDGDKVWLSFQLKENSKYDSTLGDACEGDMKNLWQDLKRFEHQIEKRRPNIKYIHGLLGYNLDYFPVTKTEIKSYFDKAADTVGLKEKLNKHDRSTLEGGMEIQRASRDFFMKTLQAYIDQEHKQIVEKTLINQDIKMSNFMAEKLRFCYKSFNRCEYIGADTTKTDDEIDFEFIGVGFGWWAFERDKEDKSE